MSRGVKGRRGRQPHWLDREKSESFSCEGAEEQLESMPRVLMRPERGTVDARLAEAQSRIGSAAVSSPWQLPPSHASSLSLTSFVVFRESRSAVIPPILIQPEEQRVCVCLSVPGLPLAPPSTPALPPDWLSPFSPAAQTPARSQEAAILFPHRLLFKSASPPAILPPSQPFRHPPSSRPS